MEIDLTSGQVVVAGSLNVDTILHVERLPGHGQTVSARSRTEGPGGKGLNQAVAAAGAGAQVSFVGCVGDDPSGVALVALLERSGVDVSGVRVDRSMPSGHATVCVDAQGENCIVVVAGANDQVRLEDTAAHPIGPGDVLLAQGEIPLGITQAFLAAGRAAGAHTVLNLAPFQPPADALLAATSVLVLNQAELVDLADWFTAADIALDGRRLVTAVQGLLAAGPEAVVLTLGSAGAVLVTAEGVEAVRGHRVAVTDTTGAGDAFTGVLAAELAAGVSLALAIGTANDAASLVVQRPGAAVAMPSRAEIDAVRGAPVA